MEKKNQKLLIIVGVLLLFGGVSLAYFVSSTKINGEGSLVDATVSEINGSVVKVEGILNFDDTNIYPGHKNIASVKLIATGDNELIPYNLVWSGTNTINTSLNYTVYKTSNPINTNANCTKKTEVIGGMQALSEECTISNIEALGTSISTGSINKGDIKVTLVSDEFITATPSGEIKYYYIVLEYPNLDTPQNEDINGVLNGKIYAEESNTKPDINILATYVIQDNGEYQQVENIPQSGYVLNTSKSTCSNGAIPSWKDNGLFVSSLTKSGTSCYLYFDKENIALIYAKEHSNGEKDSFNEMATANEGIFQASDGMYGGTSYYWRGAALTNHVIFADKCWRIVRINGDKTLRLIYNGDVLSNNTCFGNGANANSIAVTSQSYSKNSIEGRSEYVGYTYLLNSQRPGDLAAEESNMKTQNETWYKENIIDNGYDSKVAIGKFCNDRNVIDPQNPVYASAWNSTEKQFNYAPMVRLYINSNYSPTLNCDTKNDVYTLKVGAITADEIVYAGGKTYSSNSLYYLYNGQYYWTMSPAAWNGSEVNMFAIYKSGDLGLLYVSYSSLNSDSIGLRPVINLKSDVTFSSGNGEQNSPYVVES